MSRSKTVSAFSLFLLLQCSAAEFALAANWPQFRGVDACGIAEGPPPPVKWDMASGENVRWKTEIPGLGHASPIIWGERVYVVTAISGKADAELKVGLYGNIAPVEDDSVHRWMLYAVDKSTGKVAWEYQLHEGVPKVKRHTKATHANATPATDGNNIVVMLGSEGLYCVGVDGKLRWRVDLGTLDSGYYMVPTAQWGFAASPVIHDDRVVVQCDVQGESFIAAFALADGKELWRTARDEVPTWSTPAVHVDKDRAQVIANGYKHIAGYDLRTGAELWHMTGGGDIPVPTPVVANDLVYITNAHGMAAPLFAVRLNATGDISLKPDENANEYVAWREPRNGAYMQTPLVLDGYVYSCTDSGVLSCFDAKTGERRYRQRIGGGNTGFTASPVAHGDHLYFTSEEGDVYIIRAGPEFKEVAHNTMGEVCMATPAIADGVLLVRTQKHLVAIGK